MPNDEMTKVNPGNSDTALETKIGNVVVGIFAVAIGAVVLAVLALPGLLAHSLSDLRWLATYPGLLLAFTVWVAACRRK